MQGSGVLKKSINSGKWLTAGYVIQRLISLVSFFILARLLTPADFGIMAFILLVPKFLQSTSDTGFSSAAIQKEGDVLRYLSPIWTIGLLKGAIIATVVYVFGPEIAKFLNVEQATTAIRLGGLFVFIHEFSNIGELYFFKDLDFKKVFWRNLFRQISYVVVAVGATFYIQNYWALVLGTLAMFLTEVISTYFLHPFRPKITFRFRRLKDLFGYSKWMVGQGWLGQGYAFLEQTLIGRLTNVGSFGLYTKAKSVASVAPGFLSSVITFVSFPAYAKIKESKDKVRDGLLKSFDLLFVVIIPVAFLVLAAGGKLILIFLGPQWLPMTAAFQILLFYFVMHTIVDMSYSLFNGIGHPDKKVKYETLKIPLTLILVYFLTKNNGIEGASFALLLGTLPFMLLSLVDLKKLTGVGYSTIISTILIPLITSIALFLPVLVYKEQILTKGTLFFIALGGVLGLIYLGVIYLFGVKLDKGPYKTLQVVLRHIR